MNPHIWELSVSAGQESGSQKKGRTWAKISILLYLTVFWPKTLSGALLVSL